MSRDQIIKHSLQERRKQKALDQALRDCAQPTHSPVSEREGFYDPDAQAAINQARKTLLEWRRQEVRRLIEAGADVNIFAPVRGKDGKPVGMMRLVNHFLREEGMRDTGALLVETGAVVDQETVRILADRAQFENRSGLVTGALYASFNLPAAALPRWFSPVLERALATPGLDWNELTQEHYLPGGVPLQILGRQAIGRPIRLKACIAMVVVGFEDRLYDIQQARGEAAGLPALPMDMTPDQASDMLYSVVGGDQKIERLERIDMFLRVKQLLQLGADPMKPQPDPWKSKPAQCTLDIACFKLDAEVLDELLAKGAKPTKHQAQAAVRGAMEKLQRLAGLVVPDGEPQATSDKLCAVLVRLDAHGVVDLQDTVSWNRGVLAALDRPTSATMQAAIEEHMPMLLEKFLPHQQARQLGQTTPEVSSPTPRVRRF